MAAPVILHLDNGFQIGINRNAQERCDDHDHARPVQPIPTSADERCANDVDSLNDKDVAVTLSVSDQAHIYIDLHRALAGGVENQADPGC